ncbi:hypothetical protein F5Y18DRAFT_384802 [Xylariaceae sp. FL1019]|nr:hypothetical protein F5Y18DRAFT_384802 [Xylariaceae sp. FL1019]
MQYWRGCSIHSRCLAHRKLHDRCPSLLSEPTPIVSYRRDTASHCPRLPPCPPAASRIDAMAARSVSPGAALLRSSRLFSIPTPLPAATDESASATKTYSATATIPFPTHLSITTPLTSRNSGDWGFKRSLPLKRTTKQTIPLIRLRQVDSAEHVTDFASASDHSITLKKFQELNLPISMPESESHRGRPDKSVFEEAGDITALDSSNMVQTEDIRWRFKGPWLAGMTDGQFNRWLQDTVRSKRAEFNIFLKEAYAQELTEQRAKQATEAQLPAPPALTAKDITDAQLVEYLIDIRQDRLVLFRHVSRFFDLAPLPGPAQVYNVHRMKEGRAQIIPKPNPFSSQGPPITHPSAGLSYLRTSSFVDNHPIYGPQRKHAPVKGRILKPVNKSTGVHHPIIGVAGFVANLDKGMLSNPSNRQEAVTRLNLDGQGGSTVYYNTESASVGPTGRVSITVHSAAGGDGSSSMSELVQRELVGDGEPRVYQEATEQRPYRRLSQFRNSEGRLPLHKRPGTHIVGSSETYGMS